tara:strand:- start:184 stop:1752 length:1569 start_codon:yes stop_codon:yes gene_type:complete
MICCLRLVRDVFWVSGEYPRFRRGSFGVDTQAAQTSGGCNAGSGLGPIASEGDKMDWIVGILDQLVAFLGDQTRQGAFKIIGSVFAAIVVGIVFLVKWREGNRGGGWGHPAVVLSPRSPRSSGEITLTIEEYDRRLRKQEEGLDKQIREAVGKERQALEAQKEELVARLANIETSYENAVAQIRQLEEALTVAGEDISDQRLEAAMEALNAGDSALAENLFDEIEEAQAPALERAAKAAFGKGIIAEERVDWPAAAKNFQRSVSLFQAEPNLHKASVYLWRSGLYGASIQVGNQLLAKIEERTGRMSAEFASAMNNIAGQFYELGEVDEAIEKFDESINIQRSLGLDHTAEFACSLAGLANIYIKLGKFEPAERLHRQALSIVESEVGREDDRYAAILNGIAETLRLQGRFHEAEVAFKDVIELDKKLVGVEHPFYARDLHFYSKLLRQTERFEEAKELLCKAIEISRNKVGEHHPNTYAIADSLAWILRRMVSNADNLKWLADLEGVFGDDIGTIDDEGTN